MSTSLQTTSIDLNAIINLMMVMMIMKMMMGAMGEITGQKYQNTARAGSYVGAPLY